MPGSHAQDAATLDTFRDTSLATVIGVLILAHVGATEIKRLVARRRRREDKEAGGLATGMLADCAPMLWPPLLRDALVAIPADRRAGV